MKNADLPAMPQDADWKSDMESHINTKGKTGIPSLFGTGLTKREEFALKIFCSLAKDADRDTPFKILREVAIEQANLLLSDLEKAQ